MHLHLKGVGVAIVFATLLTGSMREAAAQTDPPTPGKFDQATVTNFQVLNSSGTSVTSATYKTSQTFHLQLNSGATATFNGINGIDTYNVLGVSGFYELFSPVSGRGTDPSVSLSNTAGWTAITNDHSVAGFASPSSSNDLLTPASGSAQKGDFTFDSSNQTAASSTVTFGFYVHYLANDQENEDYITISSKNTVTSAVPEPPYAQMASLLILSGGVGLLQLRRKRRQV